jgi:hypothetical protein
MKIHSQSKSVPSYSHSKQVPQFQGAFQNFANALDFEDMAASSFRHSQFIYTACILSRMIAARDRSWNEVREHGVRDILGWTFWFYAIPMVHRLFLAGFAPEDVKPVLLKANERPSGEAAKGIMGWLRKANWTINPLARWSVPSGNQIKERGKQLIHKLIEIGAESHEIQAAEKLLEKQSRWRSYASAMGLGIAFALLGIGINWLNIQITRKNVAEGKVGLK